MKRTRIVGLCLVAACALFALTASSALAEAQLEFGKCTKLSTLTGKYKNGGCTKFALTKEEEKKYEWEPLTGKTVKFTSLKKKETGEAVLTNINKETIQCKSQKEAKGEYGPGNKEQKKIVGEFEGCTGLEAECQSEGSGKNGNINTEPLIGGPGVIKKELNEEKNIDGADLKGEEEQKEVETELGKKENLHALAKFACGPAPVLVRGGVIVKAPTNKMLNKVEVIFAAAEGKQEFREWIPSSTGFPQAENRYEKGEAAIIEHLEGKLTFAGKWTESGQTLITIQKSNPTTVKLELRQCKLKVANSKEC